MAAARGQRAVGVARRIVWSAYGSAVRKPCAKRRRRGWRARERAWSVQARGSHTSRARSANYTFASLMIAAGVNAKALSTYMGHSNIGITLDRCGHLMPGNEAEAAGLLDAYLNRAESQARIASVAA